MSSNLKIRDPSTQPRQRMHTTGAFFAGDQNGSNIRCVFCDAEHFSASCEKIKDPQARKNILKRQGRCFLCLRKGHRINQCTSNRRCRKCPGKHHQSICEFNSSRPPQDPSSQPPENKPGQASTTGAVVNESSNGTTTTSNGDNHVTSNLILQQPSYSILNYEQPSNLTDSLARFWDSESIGIVDYTESDHQRKEFLKDIAFDKTEGKYQVDLPWKEEQTLQNSNFGLCVSRLHHLNSRLSKEGLLDQYDDIFKEQERTETSEHKSSEGELSKINLLADTSPELRAAEKLQEKSSEVKILGLNWNTERDCFSFDVELVNNKSWWNGPEFLKENPESWPKSATTNTNELADKELLKHPPVVTSSLPCVSKNVSRVANLENIIDIERYSTKIKLLRVTAIVMRFVKLLKRKANVPTKHLTRDELRTAEIDWIKSVQTCSFKTEQNALMKGGMACLHQFELQLDTNGLICCKGRLHNADVPESSKNPIILPSRHRFTELLIRERHEDIHHQGIRDTLNSIRQQYWILKGREAVKRVIR
ncbi:Hypothetical predicted protein [Paramuricea clavata]|uniref:Uncharacterized protein n=1 Tax=Paramuricea clavata TaxID=317549 RepID=A0A7D9E277_PARCT|nr:Hypothetical predicted protein [Paramuricea clavata]